MFCSSCGKRIPTDSLFCPECGHQLRSDDATLPTGGTVTKTAPLRSTASAPTVSQGLNIGVIASTVIIPLIGLIMGFIYMRDEDQQKKSAGKVWLWTGVGAMIFWFFVTAGSGY